MQTDQQMLAKMLQTVKEKEKESKERGISLHHEVLDDSSEEEEN